MEKVNNFHIEEKVEGNHLIPENVEEIVSLGQFSEDALAGVVSL